MAGVRARRLAILVSGSGSNMRALVAACESGELQAEVVLVLGDRPCGGLDWAREHGLPTALVDKGAYRRRRRHEDAVVEALEGVAPDWVCLAGYMRILGAEFVARWAPRLVNIHPALLPAFPGLDGQGQAFEHGVRVAGCTVHLVDAGVDTGPIVVQRAVPVLDDDDEASLRRRILDQEHQAYPEAMRRLLTEPWSVLGRRLVFVSQDNSD